VQSWAQQSLAVSGEPADSPADPLLEVLRQLGVANRDVTASDRLAEDLHLDSLAMVQLQVALETRFGLELDDAAWQQVKTVGDLRGLIGRHQPGPIRSEESGAPTKVIPAPLRAVAGQGEGAVFPRWPWWAVVRLVRIGFIEGIMRPLVWLLLGPRVAPALAFGRPSLLVANHLTAVDVPVILYSLSATDRERVAVAMSGELLTGWRRGKAQRHRILGALTPLAYWLVTALFNVFPLPRGAGLRQSFAHAGEALDQGYHVLVFPEGRRSRIGRLQPFEPGIGLLAQESEVPVQPIFVEGLGLQDGNEWPKRGTVAVRLGEPLILAPGEEPLAFTRRLEAAVAALEKV
jgi:long-chain acyl-CoA synthetase